MRITPEHRGSPLRAARSGFTLIELLAVILIIGILAAALVPMASDAFERAEATACESNLSNIYKAIVIYKNKYDRLPDQSGVRFVCQPYARRAIEQTKSNAEKLTCPAVDKSALAIGTLPWDEWWSDMDLVGPDYSAYAGRDMKNHPLRSLTGKEPLIADDNDPQMNHPTTTNVLYGNGAVETFEVVLLQEEGLLDPENDHLVVGPDSPVEDLRKLSLD